MPSDPRDLHRYEFPFAIHSPCSANAVSELRDEILKR